MESSGNEILDRILKDAKDEAKSITEEAKNSAKKLIEQQRQLARHSAEKEANSLLKSAENDAEIIRGKVSTDIRSRASWIVLSEKNRLITNVLDEVKQRLVAMQKSKDYPPVLEKMIVDAGTVLGGGTLEVMLNEGDSSLKLDKLEKKIADNTGAETQLNVSGQRIKAGGVIVKTVDGRAFVDNTFEAMLRRRERELRLKVAKILFTETTAS